MTITDPYDFVLRDLRVQRDNIDAAIKAIEMVRGTSARDERNRQTLDEKAQSPSSLDMTAVSNSSSTPYAGLTIYDACIKVLCREDKPLSTVALTDAIQQGGLQLNANDPYNTVGSVLTRRFYDHGDVVRVGRATWGLPDWFPNHDYRAEALEKRAGKEALLNPPADAMEQSKVPERPMLEALSAIERWRLDTDKSPSN
ncbi:winged helix-turn-helix domain-containing protein [Methylobacterium sp. Leaf111]|uniref:winged helix-turn-helix domain-containing protein n=1 Tax=Methylobacterium sp. Leaf111 TaxID=1736257 RepID=UPI0009E821B7|nr:winged helix-turn-helix domain-containing protein [Methylobacterium sp. Leaf111]